MTDLDPKALWQDQPTEATPISLDEIKRRARWSARIIALRNGADYFVFILAGILMLHGAVFYFEELPLRLASGLGVVAMAGGAFAMWKRASAMALPDDANAADFLAFQRDQLRRQLDAIPASWLWYLAPIFATMAAFAAALMIVSPKDRGPEVLTIYIVGGIASLIFTVAFNAVRAWRLRRMLKDLERSS